MEKTILFIDGENFRHKVESILDKQKTKGLIRLENLDFSSLIKSVLNIKLSDKIYYAAKVHFHPETPKKSTELVTSQRNLKTKLEKQGFTFIISGNVRPQRIDSKIIFREKGVDVKISVDLVSLACDKKLNTAILCSSDSDLQPAITEIKRRGVKVVYLGFEDQPNKGLMYTCNKSVLIKTPQIVNNYSVFIKK